MLSSERAGGPPQATAGQLDRGRVDRPVRHSGDGAGVHECLGVAPRGGTGDPGSHLGALVPHLHRGALGAGGDAPGSVAGACCPDPEHADPESTPSSAPSDAGVAPSVEPKLPEGCWGVQTLP